MRICPAVFVNGQAVQIVGSFQGLRAAVSVSPEHFSSKQEVKLCIVGYQKDTAAADQLSEASCSLSLGDSFVFELFVCDPRQLDDLLRDPLTFRQLHEHVGAVSHAEGAPFGFLDSDRCQFNDLASFQLRAPVVSVSKNTTALYFVNTSRSSFMVGHLRFNRDRGRGCEL